jgi:hypothetical protein
VLAYVRPAWLSVYEATGALGRRKQGLPSWSRR